MRKPKNKPISITDYQLDSIFFWVLLSFSVLGLILVLT
jgi:hypothetical protein